MAVFKSAVFVALLIVLSSGSLSWAAWPEGFDPNYVIGVEQTAGPLTPSRIDYRLTTIGANDHIRNADGAILMSCFTDWSGYSRSYNGVTTSYRPKLWSAVAPEMWQYFQDHDTAPGDMSLRAKQLLGLPETHLGYYVMEFYTPTTSLFRPAMDADITHPVTSLEFVGAMADPTNPMRQWFDSNFSTYDPSMGTPYPWTRAGYTYDWGSRLDPHIGLTEFITDNQNTSQSKYNPIWVRSIIGIQSYKYYVRASDSFNVIGDCDTLWIGSYYLPVTAGGNWINIDAAATIAGGEGIVIRDRTDVSEPSSAVITNAGTILGPGINHNGTMRDSSVTFFNTGGTFYNSGTVTGDRIGVSGSSDSTRPITIHNTGTIRGTDYAIQTGGGDDQINTSGLVDGKIATRGGNDTINVQGGAITGMIDGGEGTNTMNFNLPSGSSFTYNNAIHNMDHVNVNSGTVCINGSTTGPVAVASGATFTGICAVTSDLNNWGTIAPGDWNAVPSSAPTRSIEIGGDYTQYAGSALALQMAKRATGDVFASTLYARSATLQSNSTIQLFCGLGNEKVFVTGDGFTGVFTNNGVTDQGVSIIDNSPFLDFWGYIYADRYYSISLTRTATFASVATAGNNASLAAALDADAATAIDGYAGLINQLLFTNASAFNTSLHQIGPGAYLSVSAATDRTTQYMAEALGGYLSSRRKGQANLFASQQNDAYRGALAMARAVGNPSELAETIRFCGNERALYPEMRETDRARSVWVNPFGVFYGERSGGDHVGFQSNVAGTQFGIDKLVDETCVLGIGGGYDQMHITTAALTSAGKTDTFRVGPYATWFDDEWYLDSSLTGGFHDNNLGRSAVVGSETYLSSGRYHANDVSAYLGGGRCLAVGDYLVSPMASMQYIYYRQNGFSEFGAAGTNGALLAVDPLSAQSLRSRLGGQLTRTYQWRSVKFVPEVFGGWAHEFLQNDVMEARFLGGAAPFFTDRGGIFRDAGYYGASLTTLPRERTSIFARYNGEYSTGGHFTAVDMGVVVDF